MAKTPPSPLPKPTRKTTPRVVGVIGFEGVNALDLTGPMEAFANAERADCTDKDSAGAYKIVVLGLTQEPFTAESGVRFVPHCRLDDVDALDTLIVPGGWGIREPPTTTKISTWIVEHVRRIRRIASVCTGLYAVAPTGLLDGRRVTTHWRFAEDVAKRFPRLVVDGNALYIKDSRFYTSGGITAGIDLALALIEEDHGAQAALAVARELVMYLKRPGGQAQFSDPLRFQTCSVDGFTDLIAWMCTHLARDLSADVLAAHMNLSTRHFCRRFTADVGYTPAAFVERARLHEARDRLLGSGLSIASIAASVGFRSADVFTRRFEHHFGISPLHYRERFTPENPVRDLRFHPLRSLA